MVFTFDETTTPADSLFAYFILLNLHFEYEWSQFLRSSITTIKNKDFNIHKGQIKFDVTLLKSFVFCKSAEKATDHLCLKSTIFNAEWPKGDVWW